MHAHRLYKSVLLQMFNHAISNSKIKVSLHAISEGGGEYQGAVPTIVQEYPKYIQFIL